LGRRGWFALADRQQRDRDAVPSQPAPGCCHTPSSSPITIPTTPTIPTAVLSLRLSPSERALLEAAAEQARTDLSDFVRRRALEAAEADLLDRRIVTIAAKDWARFETWAGEPAKEVPALRQLAEVRPVWQDPQQG
jgi:uncharacterized protein (DUF1778 family)